MCRVRGAVKWKNTFCQTTGITIKNDRENWKYVLEARLQVVLDEVWRPRLSAPAVSPSSNTGGTNISTGTWKRGSISILTAYFYVLGDLVVIIFRAKILSLVLERDKCFKNYQLLSHSKVNLHGIKLSEMAITRRTQLSDNTQLHFLEKLSYGLIVVKLIILISWKMKEID